MTTTLEILKSARQKIADPKRWCKGAFALDVNSMRQSCFSSHSVAWCVTGALDAVSNGGFYYACLALKCALPSAWERATITSYNDNPDTTHHDIMTLFDRAIAGLEV